MKRTLAALTALPLALTMVACSEDASPAGDTKPGARSADCLSVPRSTLKAIASDEWQPLKGAAVIGPDFSSTVYLVAIRFDDGNGAEIGVWATPDLADPGPIMSVDAMAASFSSWPQGTAAEPLDASVAGVDEAIACLE